MIGRTELHPGIVAILPSVRRDRQMELFSAALTEIQASDSPADLVNVVLEVDAEARVTRYILPPIR